MYPRPRLFLISRSAGNAVGIRRHHPRGMSNRRDEKNERPPASLHCLRKYIGYLDGVMEKRE
ncbi:Uncharacterized protein APZ42_023337 [Daphnia magna]|nr:Uncharacterized protein APZ42_023337 [Daphnia magna]